MPELAALQGELAARDIDVVLVAAGDEADNRALLDEHGPRLRTLLRAGAATDFAEPFPSAATPVAYLVDGDGRVAAPLAYGADEVLAIARQAAGVHHDAEAESKYLPGGSAGVSRLPTGGGGRKKARSGATRRRSPSASTTSGSERTRTPVPTSCIACSLRTSSPTITTHPPTTRWCCPGSGHLVAVS